MNCELNNINGLKVLYTEDDAFIREGVIEMLSPYVNNLLIARNGKEGLNMFETEKPDIVITDIRMPVMDGLEMSRQIKEINKDTPIIVTSAYSDSNSFINAIDIGISQYVLKPVKEEKLFEAINKTCKILNLQNELKRQFHTIMKLHQAIEQSSSIFIITDPDGRINYVNPKFSEITGYSFSELMDENISITLDKVSMLGKMEEVWNTLKEGKVWRGEYQNYKKNGETYWEYGSISPVKNDNNEITSFINVAEDITELKKMTEALKASEDKHRSLIENLGEGIGVLDPNYVFSFCNPALKDIFDTSQLTGRNLAEFLPKSQFDYFVEKSKIQQYEKKQFDIPIKTGSGHEKALNVTLTPQLDKLGKSRTGLFCIFKDITQIKLLIEQKDEAKRAAEQAYEIIEEKNYALNEMNNKLQKSEAKLSELNQILMEYIKVTGK